MADRRNAGHIEVWKARGGLGYERMDVCLFFSFSSRSQIMRVAVPMLAVVFLVTSVAVGFELTEEQKEAWNALEEQVALNMKKDLEAEKQYIHPKACLWGDRFPAPVSPSPKLYSFAAKWLGAQDEVVAHHMVPVSVVVVDDVAIINFYLHMLTKDKEGEQGEMVIRGHNTWKKEKGRWLLFSTYNTMVPTEVDDD